jgi:hypothetical protein
MSASLDLVALFKEVEFEWLAIRKGKLRRVISGPLLESAASSMTFNLRWGFRAFWLLLLLSVANRGVQAKSPLDGLFDERPLIKAIQEGSSSAVAAAFVAGESANVTSSQGAPAIVEAARSRNLDIVKALLQEKARPNDRDKAGDTALAIAATNGDIEIARALLDAKADVDRAGGLQETPLIRAARAGNFEMVKLLIERKANLDETDSSGATALTISQSKNNTAIVKLLRDAGAN